jgi:hypothetical protein
MRKLRPIVVEWVDETYLLVLILAVVGTIFGTLGFVISLMCLSLLSHLV